MMWLLVVGWLLLFLNMAFLRRSSSYIANRKSAPTWCMKIKSRLLKAPIIVLHTFENKSKYTLKRGNIAAVIDFGWTIYEPKALERFEKDNFTWRDALTIFSLVPYMLFTGIGIGRVTLNADFTTASPEGDTNFIKRWSYWSEPEKEINWSA